MYKELFLERWKLLEKENNLNLEKEDGEVTSTAFLKEDVFDKFFISPELLVGYYEWRESGNLNGKIEDAFDLFMEEYDGWTNEAKNMASQAKEIFEENVKTYNQEIGDY